MGKKQKGQIRIGENENASDPSPGKKEAWQIQIGENENLLDPNRGKRKHVDPNREKRKVCRSKSGKMTQSINYSAIFNILATP